MVACILCNQLIDYLHKCMLDKPGQNFVTFIFFKVKMVEYKIINKQENVQSYWRADPHLTNAYPYQEPWTIDLRVSACLPRRSAMNYIPSSLPSPVLITQAVYMLNRGQTHSQTKVTAATESRSHISV